ncbi:MAG: hypothetical protein Q7R54_01585 [bacterium]|nr:hypothetical protein [bacterium]
MHKLAIGRVLVVPLLIGGNALLVLGYIALIAVVMSYAALHVEFAQEVRSDEAVVASLESAYLARLSQVTATDYIEAGYRKPMEKTYVAHNPQTALNAR